VRARQEFHEFAAQFLLLAAEQWIKIDSSKFNGDLDRISRRTTSII